MGHVVGFMDHAALGRDAEIVSDDLVIELWRLRALVKCVRAKRRLERRYRVKRNFSRL